MPIVSYTDLHAPPGETVCGVRSELPVTDWMINRMGQFPVPNQIALELIDSLSLCHSKPYGKPNHLHGLTPSLFSVPL